MVISDMTPPVPRAPRLAAAQAQVRQFVMKETIRSWVNPDHSKRWFLTTTKSVAVSLTRQAMAAMMYDTVEVTPAVLGTLNDLGGFDIHSGLHGTRERSLRYRPAAHRTARDLHPRHDLTPFQGNIFDRRPGAHRGSPARSSVGAADAAPTLRRMPKRDADSRHRQHDRHGGSSGDGSGGGSRRDAVDRGGGSSNRGRSAGSDGGSGGSKTPRN